MNKILYPKEKCKVLVTGATGLLGVNLVQRLVALGYAVRLLVRYKSPLWPFDGLEIEQAVGDITDGKSVREAVEGCDVVFHGAGFVTFSPFLRERAVQVNVVGTHNVIEACQGAKVERLVHVSSIAAVGYGSRGELVNETAPWNFKSLADPYHDTKRAAEEGVLQAVAERALPAVVVNPAYVLGPWDMKPSSGRLILLVASGKVKVYPTGGISVVHVRDVVEGMIRALHRGRVGERYILGGDNLAYREVLTKLARVVGVAPPRIPLQAWVTRPLGWMGDQLGQIWPRAFADINTPVLASGHAKHYVSSEKAQRELGYTYRPAEAAMEDAYRWFVQHGYLKKRKAA